MDQEAIKTQFLSAYDAYGNAIFRFCVLKVSNRELAQDLSQEVFMRYWQSLRKGEDFKNERAYLYTLARNLVIDWYRKKKEASLDALTDAGLEFKGDGAHSITDKSEVREILEVIDKLDEDDREALLLRFVEGFSPKEIAELLDESANVISVRIHRALKKVQELIHANETTDSV
jgi:RNA polymerase sigma-70 factor (ECF subfamily)